MAILLRMQLFWMQAGYVLIFEKCSPWRAPLLGTPQQTSLLLFQNHEGWKRKKLRSMEDTAKVPEPETDTDKLLVVGGGV